jgi:serine protease Do
MPSKLSKQWIVLVAGLGAAAALVAVPVIAQSRNRETTRLPDALLLQGPGSSIGATIRDIEPSEATAQKLERGVLVDDVRPNSPAERAGLRKADVVTDFDGEPVRSARQFARLVRETPPGKTVNATVVRSGQRTVVSVAPERAPAVTFFDRERLREDLGTWNDRLRDFNFDFDFDWDDATSPAGRLGVVVHELTPQLATYFGAKEGVLVAEVSDGTPAARAGLRAGDVIVSVGQRTVTSRRTLVRELRDVADNQDVAIGIVRDKKQSSVTARLDRQTRRPARPVRSTRVATGRSL